MFSLRCVGSTRCTPGFNPASSIAKVRTGRAIAIQKPVSSFKGHLAMLLGVHICASNSRRYRLQSVASGDDQGSTSTKTVSQSEAVSPTVDAANSSSDAPPPAIPPMMFLRLSTLFYVGMAAASAVGGRALGLREDLLIPQVLTPHLQNLPIGLGCTGLLFGSLLAVSSLSDRVPMFGEMRDLLRGILGSMRDVPVWGLGLLALGAGFGEEALFRGVLQTAITAGVTNADVPLPLAEQAGLWSSSIVFGLAHAVTPFYTIWATFAGALFGWEYLSTGSLDAPVFTHALYDFLAFVYLSNDAKRQLAAVKREDDDKDSVSS